MFGFGAPEQFNATGAPGPYGWGDIQPFNSAGGPVLPGFGDIPSFDGSTIQVLPLVESGEYPDDGGSVKVLLNVPEGGPYRVRLYEKHTQQYYPQDRFGCWGCEPGNDWQCYSKSGQLLFALPAVPPGDYQIKIYWGPGFGQTATASQEIRVIWRGRQDFTWSMRSHYPPHWTAAGPRVRQAEKLLGL
jgi:hypothetical protein